MSTQEREIAQKQQEKFEFYLISLVFTLLALSIQSATFGVSNVADCIELLGWVCLLVSGIAGLWRLEYLSVERVKLVQKEEYKDKVIEMQQLLQNGVKELHVVENNAAQSVSERMQEYQHAVDVLGPVVENLEKSNLRKYSVHRYSFVVAVGALVLSRAYIPASNLLRGLGTN